MSRTIGPEDLPNLNDRAIFLTKGGILFRKYKGWYETGVDGYIRNQWVYPNDTQGNVPYKIEAFTRDPFPWFPAELIHEGEQP